MILRHFRQQKLRNSGKKAKKMKIQHILPKELETYSCFLSLLTQTYSLFAHAGLLRKPDKNLKMSFSNSMQNNRELIG